MWDETEAKKHPSFQVFNHLHSAAQILVEAMSRAPLGTPQHDDLARLWTRCLDLRNRAETEWRATTGYDN